MGTAGGAQEFDCPESNPRAVRVSKKTSEFESDGTDQGFRRLQNYRVEDFQSEGGVSGGGGEGQNEPLVPYGSGRT